MTKKMKPKRKKKKHIKLDWRWGKDFTIEKFFHIAVTCVDGELSLYIDGVKK